MNKLKKLYSKNKNLSYVITYYIIYKEWKNIKCSERKNQWIEGKPTNNLINLIVFWNILRKWSEAKFKESHIKILFWQNLKVNMITVKIL